MNYPIDILRRCPIFSRLEDSDLQLIASKVEQMELNEGQYLFHEDDPGEELFILSSGKLAAITTYKGTEKIIGIIRPGELAGELSFFSNRPRSASIKALSPSVVLRLSRTDFKALCDKDPKILWETTNFIAKRAQSTIGSIFSAKQQIIALISIGIPIDVLLEEFKKNNSSNLKLNIITTSELKNSTDPANLLKKAINHEFSAIYGMESSDLDGNGELLKLSDKIVIAIKSESRDLPLIKEIIKERIDKKAPNTPKTLLLLHDRTKTWYPNTRDFLNLANFSKWHHLSFDAPVSFIRMLKFLSGNAVGLVVSGGGAKGWGAAGVISAFYDNQTEIDHTGGTSIGGIAAVSYALSATKEEFNKLLDILTSTFGPKRTHPFSFKNMTLPLFSVLSGKKETEKIKELCGDVMIEDLALPFFCISTNLSTYSEHVWERGNLWQAIRASLAIPPLLPPLVHEGQIHVDGGVVNNFPVDIMSNKLDNQGFIIGIQILTSTLDPQKYNFPPSVGFFEACKILFKLTKEKINYISVLEIIERTIAVGSLEEAVFNSKKADLLIKPNLNNFSFTDFLKKDEMMAIGYEEAKKQLANVKSLSTKSFGSKI